MTNYRLKNSGGKKDSRKFGHISQASDRKPKKIFNVFFGEFQNYYFNGFPCCLA